MAHIMNNCETILHLIYLQHDSLTYCYHIFNVQIILLLFCSTKCQDCVGYNYIGNMIKTDFMSYYDDKINLKHIVKIIGLQHLQFTYSSIT